MLPPIFLTQKHLPAHSLPVNILIITTHFQSPNPPNCPRWLVVPVPPLLLWGTSTRCCLETQRAIIPGVQSHSLRQAGLKIFVCSQFGWKMQLLSDLVSTYKWRFNPPSSQGLSVSKLALIYTRVKLAQLLIALTPIKDVLIVTRRDNTVHC